MERLHIGEWLMVQKLSSERKLSWEETAHWGMVNIPSVQSPIYTRAAEAAHLPDSPDFPVPPTFPIQKSSDFNFTQNNKVKNVLAKRTFFLIRAQP